MFLFSFQPSFHSFILFFSINLFNRHLFVCLFIHLSIHSPIHLFFNCSFLFYCMFFWFSFFQHSFIKYIQSFISYSFNSPFFLFPHLSYSSIYFKMVTSQLPLLVFPLEVLCTLPFHALRFKWKVSFNSNFIITLLFQSYQA